MKSAVVQLPGLNRDRDMIAALTKISGKAPVTIWQTETDIPDVDLIVIPGGFSYGDYLRCGAIAARMPVMQAIKAKAEAGVKVLGVCNGFQILVEAGLLPGALMRNASLKFVCREIKLEVVNANTDFSRAYEQGQIIRCPVAHHDGNYFADSETLETIEDNGQGGVPVCRRHQSKRLGQRYRRDRQCRRQCSRHDAASGKPDRGRPWRFGRTRTVRFCSRRNRCLTFELIEGTLETESEGAFMHDAAFIRSVAIAGSIAVLGLVAGCQTKAPPAPARDTAALATMERVALGRQCLLVQVG